LARKIVTLYIDDSSIRLMVSRGKRLNKLVSAQLQLGSAELKEEIKEAEITTKIKHLLKANKVRAKKVVLGISGRNCLSRPVTLPQLPRAMLEEAVTREARRVLPVPPEQLYLSWQARPAPEGKIQVFLVAIPRRIADNLIKITRQAGLKPYLMDIKPLALARVVKEKTAIIVDVQSIEADIIIMADGIPQPVRTIPFPSEVLSSEEKLAMVRQDVQRTIEFYNSNNPENPLDDGTPIFVTGELAEKPDLGKSLADELGYPLSVLTSPLKNPKKLDLTNYMVNVGLTLKELTREAGPSIANLNTLPAPYRAKPISVSRIIAVPSAVIIVVLLAGGIMAIQATSADIDAMNDQLNNTTHIVEQKLSRKQELQQEIDKLEKRVATATALRDSFTSALAQIENGGNTINGDLQAITSNLLAGIQLSHIGHSRTQINLSGSALSEQEVLSFARNLDKSGRFTEVTIASIRRVDVGQAESEEGAGEEGTAEGEEAAGEEEDTGEAEATVEEGEATGEEGTGEENEEDVNEDMVFNIILTVGGKK